jgi:TatD DNase family protein
MTVEVITETQKTKMFGGKPIPRPNPPVGRPPRRDVPIPGGSTSPPRSPLPAASGGNQRATNADAKPKKAIKIPISPIKDENKKTVPIIDIGANLASKNFKWEDMEGILKRASEAGVSHIIVTGTNYKNSRAALELCREFDGKSGVTLRCTVGIHPHDATRALNPPERKGRDGETERKFTPKPFDKLLEDLIRSDLGKAYCVAVGECGLDYDRNFSTPEDQKVVFRKQLTLAQRLNKPVFLHCREAHKDFVNILKPFSSAVKAVVHCYTDPSVQHVQELLAMGCYFGLTGIICDERKGRFNTDIISYIPLDRMMVETDSPFLFPRNVPRPWGEWGSEPCLLPYVVKKIVDVCGDCTNEECAKGTTDVAKAFFKL